VRTLAPMKQSMKSAKVAAILAKVGLGVVELELSAGRVAQLWELLGGLLDRCRTRLCRQDATMQCEGRYGCT